MRFIADAMLGKLARWMRFAGYDVLYSRSIDDRELVRTARAEGRIVLTRDTRLPKDYSVRHMLILSERLKEQLSEVFSVFPPEGETGRRCMRCNAVLEDVPRREDVRDLIPEYIYLHHDSFMRCSACGSVYWPGTHMESILKSIREIRSRLNVR